MKYKYRERNYMKKMLMILTFCAAFIVNGNMKKVQAAEWYDNYDYTLNNSAKTITLRASKGTLGATATVPGNAIINGVSYTTILDNSSFSSSGFWEADKDNLTSLIIQSGVKATAGCHHLFYNLSNLETIDVSGLDTSEITDMSYMFEGCSKLLYLDLSNFNTEKVTTMVHMFYGCTKLLYIDISNFNTKEVREMDYMFGGTFGNQMLQNLDLRSFNFAKISSECPFLADAKIVNLYLPKTNCIKKQDLTGMNNLARIYFEGTEYEWNALDNTYGSDVKIIYNYTEREISTEPQVENPDTSSWYNDYNYFLDTKNYKLIIMNSKGTGLTSANVPAYTLIGERTYKTVLHNFYARKSTPLSLWANDLESLKEIKIEDGVEVVDECSGLFRFNKQTELITLSLGSLDTSNVVYMDYMFGNLSIFSLDLRNMDMSNADTTKMFDKAVITNLYLPENAMKGYNLSGITGLTNIYYTKDKDRWNELGNVTGTIPITYNYTGPISEPTTVTVSFNGNGGTVAISQKEFNIGEKFGELPIPTKSGYTFDGWYTEISGGTKIEETTMVSKNVARKLYAHWSESKGSTNDVTKNNTSETTKDKKTTETNNEKTGATVEVSTKTISSKSSVILSLKQTKKGRKLKVKYNKFIGATGYQVQYSTSKKFNKKVTLNVKKTTATTKKLKKGKRYYVRVRAYIKSGKKKKYSKWSDVKRSSKIK